MPRRDLPLNSDDLDDLKRAKSILENPGFAIKVANYLGKPIEFAIEKIDSPILKSVTSKADTVKFCSQFLPSENVFSLLFCTFKQLFVVAAPHRFPSPLEAFVDEYSFFQSPSLQCTPSNM